MNGLQLAQAVKDASPNTRVVLITAYNTPELKRQVRSSGVDEYLAKPFSLDRIEQIVRDSLL
jgi:YesN/AraC family two-component response regulator